MTTIQEIAEHHLPRELRLDLCTTLLEEAGARSINVRENRGEIIHCCVMPWHQENRPSASLNFDSLTYRCLGCGAKGGLYWLIMQVRGLGHGEVREWLSGITGFGGREFQIAPLLAFLDALEESQAQGHAKPPVPVYPEVAIEEWSSHIYPGLTSGVPDLNIPGRGIPEENLRMAKVGWDMSRNRVVIPNFWSGQLVGWQSRRIVNDGTPKYESTPDFPRDSTILGLDRADRSKPILVVESPMSYLRHVHHLPIAATWGSVITDAQISLLKWFPEVCFWMDPDEAGWKSIEGYVNDRGRATPGAIERLMPYTSVTVVDSDWAADPAEFDDDVAATLYAERIPAALWQRPSRLRCIACKQYHGGACAPTTGEGGGDS